MTLYYCKGIDQVVAVHSDEQALEPVTSYGYGTYVIVDKGGPAGAHDPADPLQIKWLYPTITPAMEAASVKAECRYRILRAVSEQSQRNITTYISEIQSKAIMSIGATPPTPAEQTDLTTAKAIWDWIGRPSGMQAAADALIAANDMEWWLDGKWPAWNPAWDAFVARF